MTAIVEYGVGNLFSLQCSLAALGLAATVTGDVAVLESAERVILPGVGAFGDAMEKLRQTGLAQPLRRLAGQGKPLLGICLGMQLLFDESREFGTHAGLGLVAGKVLPLEDALRAGGYNYKVPHMGWNCLEKVHGRSPLLKYTGDDDYFYYVHSFYATGCEEALVAQSEYGVMVPGVVQNKNVFGTQFHPEKSGDVGLAMLKAFAEVT
ncbi:imidazole glycerol phosphate synthase subunit HisH [Ruminococcaceae bacterium OttesenSCG-928-O06]|nr:imidazole glycerol phosphate synthase subunit HisH [Ruminococcaceae bacterium OttesenSCG-928-O06]